MFLEVFFENGFNFIGSIKDTVHYKKNRKNYPNTMKKYQKIMDGKLGFLVDRFSSNVEEGIQVKILYFDEIETYYATSSDYQYQNYNEKFIDKHSDIYFIDDFTNLVDVLTKDVIFFDKAVDLDVINQLIKNKFNNEFPELNQL